MISIQGLTSTRQKDKFVPLPNGSSNALNLLAPDEDAEAPLTASDDNYLPSHYGRPGTAFSAHKPGSAELLRQADMVTFAEPRDHLKHLESGLGRDVWQSNSHEFGV